MKDETVGDIAKVVGGAITGISTGNVAAVAVPAGVNVAKAVNAGIKLANAKKDLKRAERDLRVMDDAIRDKKKNPKKPFVQCRKEAERREKNKGGSTYMPGPGFHASK
jgi:hypothetical protein